MKSSSSGRSAGPSSSTGRRRDSPRKKPSGSSEPRRRSSTATSGTLQYPEPGTIAEWLRDYSAPQAAIDDAKAKAKWIRQGSPANWQESAPDGFTRFTEIELLATSIHIHEDAYVTGSLQTPSYAEAVLATNPNLDNDKRQAAVSFRMQRADTLFGRQSGPLGCKWSSQRSRWPGSGKPTSTRNRSSISHIGTNSKASRSS
ncbi:hypothetical protein GCM10029992_00010 [Glycomyces albus]